MTDARTPESGAPSGVLPRWRTSRPGRPATGVGTWAARAPWFALVGAVGLAVGAGVWPLAHPESVELIEPPAVSPVTMNRPSVTDRERALAALTSDNLFAPDRAFWAAPPPPVAEGEGEPGDHADDPDGSGSTTGTRVTGANGDSGPRVITNPDEMPKDLRDALANLRLIGVREDSEGQRVAMIAHSQDLSKWIDHRVGDEIVDQQRAGAKWTIEGIDVVYDRVTLERLGKRVSLALYPSEPPPMPPTPVSDATPGESQTPSAAQQGATAKSRVVEATRADVVKELRDAGVDEQEIVQLMTLLDQDPSALAAAREAIAAKRGEAATTGADTGIASVMQLMRQVEDEKSKRGGQPGGTPPPDPPK